MINTSTFFIVTKLTKLYSNYFLIELRTTQQGQVYFFHIPTGVSTWHDPRIPKDLAPLSLALDHLGPLPPGWEMRQTATGRVFPINLKKTPKNYNFFYRFILSTTTIERLNSPIPV